MRLKRKRKRIETRREKLRFARWAERFCRFGFSKDYAPLAMGEEYTWR